jgi:hypothetical protein
MPPSRIWRTTRPRRRLASRPRRSGARRMSRRAPASS